ncbi:MAG: transposase [Solirubrobacteraceae bacterium]
MKRKLHAVEVATPEEARVPLPDEVQLRLGEIADVATEGLLALASAAGLAVLHECMEHEVEVVVGPKGRHDVGRESKRHGHTPGEVTLGGRRVPISRPRVRTADDRAEVELESYREFGSRDPLERVALERMLAGVSTRRSRRVAEPVGAEVEQQARSTSKSAVSRAFVGKTGAALDELLARDLSGVELAVVMIDGIELAGMTHVVALGITADGTKVPLSLREGSTENATVATALLSDLVDRGLRLHEQQLFVLDGAKALRKAVRDVAGTRVPVQRCQRHYADLRVMPTRVRTSCSGRGSRRSCRHNHSAWRNARMRSVGW